MKPVFCEPSSRRVLGCQAFPKHIATALMKVQPSVKCKVLMTVSILSEYIVAFSTQICQWYGRNTHLVMFTITLCSLTAQFTPIIQLSCFDFCITDVLTVPGFLYAYVFCVSFCSVWELSLCFFFFLHWGPALGTLCPMSFLRVKNKKQALCLQSNYAI